MVSGGRCSFDRMDDVVVKHTKVLGDRATAHVLARLMEVYDTVLLPFGENQRYDLLVETKEGAFLKIQCKTGRLRKGAIRFPAASSSYHHPNTSRYENRKHSYRGQADYFGVYCPETEKVYLVPVDEVGLYSGFLRVEATLNKQAKNIRWAADYEVKLSPEGWRTAMSDHGSHSEQGSLVEEDAIPYLFPLPG
jgi:hypothetical protein